MRAHTSYIAHMLHRHLALVPCRIFTTSHMHVNRGGRVQEDGTALQVTFAQNDDGLAAIEFRKPTRMVRPHQPAFAAVLRLRGRVSTARRVYRHQQPWCTCSHASTGACLPPVPVCGYSARGHCRACLCVCMSTAKSQGRGAQRNGRFASCDPPTHARLQH